jgi:hypothetical protein
MNDPRHEPIFELEYSDLVDVFLKLRAKGMSLGSLDLDILEVWKTSGLKPEFLIHIMLEYAEECRCQSRNFPSTLLPISHKVRSVLLKLRES